MAKLLGTEHEELYKNFLKPRIKVGNEFVTQGRNKDQVSTFMQPPTYCQMYKVALSGFKFKASQKLSFPCSCHKFKWGNGFTFPLILKLSPRQIWVVSFMPNSLPNGNNPRYPPRFEVVRSSEPVWMFRRRGKSLTATGFWHPHDRARRLFTIQTELPWLIFQTYK